MGVANFAGLRTLLFIFIIIIAATSTVFGSVLYVHLEPPLQGVKIDVCNATGIAGECATGYTDSNGLISFSLTPGIYIVQIYVPKDYEFLYWTNSTGIYILCSEDQNPVYINLTASEGTLLGHLKYLSGIYLNGYIDSEIDAYPEIKLYNYTSGKLLFTSQSSEFSFQLVSLGTYELVIPRKYNATIAGIRYRCFLDNAEIVSEDFELLKQYNSSDVEHFVFKALDKNVNLYASYSCQELFPLTVNSNSSKLSEVCIYYDDSSIDVVGCANVSSEKPATFYLPEGYYWINATKLPRNLSFYAWNINGVEYTANPVRYYIYYPSTATLELSPGVQVSPQPPSSGARLCELEVSANISGITLLISDLDTRETLGSYSLPVTFQLNCSHRYELVFPVSIDQEYKLENVNVQGLRILKLNLSQGLLDFEFAESHSSVTLGYSSIAGSQQPSNLYPLDAYAEVELPDGRIELDSSAAICVYPVDNPDASKCNISELHVRLPEGYYYLKVIPAPGSSDEFELWNINGIEYTNNPVKYYLYFPTQAFALLKRVVHRVPASCVVQVTSEGLEHVNFSLIDFYRCTNETYITPVNISLDCNRLYELEFYKQWNNCQLVGFNVSNYSIVVAKGSNYVRFNLTIHKFNVTLHYTCPSQPPEQPRQNVTNNQTQNLYNLLVLSDPVSNVTVCVKDIASGASYCNVTPTAFRLPEGYYLLEAKVPEGYSFYAWNINGVEYYNNPVEYYLYFDSEAVVELQPLKALVKIYSRPISVDIRVINAKTHEQLYSGETPASLQLVPGKYLIEYPNQVDSYNLSSRNAYGSVKWLNATSFYVSGNGELELVYSYTGAVPGSGNATNNTQGSQNITGCIEVISPYNKDVTVIKDSNNNFVRKIIGTGKLCGLNPGDYYLYTQTEYLEPYMRLYFDHWEIPGVGRFTGSSLKVHVNGSIVRIVKVFKLYYLLQVRVLWYNHGPLSNVPVRINNETMRTDSQGYVRQWILNGTKVRVSVPSKLEYQGTNLSVDVSVVEFRMLYPKTEQFVYYSASQKQSLTGQANATTGLISGYATLRILVYDQYGDPVVQPVDFFIYRQISQGVYQKVEASNGVGKAILPPGKYLLLALDRYQNFTIGFISGCDNLTGVNLCEINLKPNQTRNIVVVYYYNPGYLILRKLVLNILDASSEKPVASGMLRICKIILANGSISRICSRASFVNGFFAGYFEAGKYLVRVVAPGYASKQIYVDLTKFNESKVIRLTPLSSQQKTQVSSSRQQEAKRYKVIVLGYPSTWLWVYRYPANILVGRYWINSSGLANLELSEGSYLFVNNGTERVVKVDRNLGILLRKVSAKQPAQQLGAQVSYLLEVCVLRDKHPVSFVGITLRDKTDSYTIAYQHANASGCATFTLSSPGIYVLHVDSVIKRVNVTSSFQKVIIELKEASANKAKNQLRIIAAALLLLSLVVVIALRFLYPII
jgi:hypothetical protein